MEETQTTLDKLEDYAKSLELDIKSTQEQVQNETDDTHITFLDDHLNMLNYELCKVHADIIFCGKTKKFHLNL